ncbi:MAG: hypothetical protein M1840_004067 [Geoglossum simile]|nr:MAG: hypothetical protein M1840_004067 [Geoglossum simile]
MCPPPHHDGHSRRQQRTGGRKRRRGVARDTGDGDGDGGVDTSKPTAVFRPGGGRRWTLSVAVPGSIIANAQTHELKTMLAGQIARAAAVFCVDEVVVFEDTMALQTHSQHAAGEQISYTGVADPAHFLSHVLSYLEAPPHLRRQLFPLHPNLRFAGQLPSLDMPHHLRGDEWCEYREGVVVSGRRLSSKGELGEGAGVTVDAGLSRKVMVETEDGIELNTRITVRLPRNSPATTEPYIQGTPTHPSAPRTVGGYYWGYTVRRTASLSGIFTEAPYPNGYTLSVGMSERGRPISSLLASPSPLKSTPLDTAQEEQQQQQHIVVVFGGLAGLEAAASVDEELGDLGVGDGEVERLFDWWVDVCPGQGSRTIRTEEAVWLGLMGVREWLVGGDGKGGEAMGIDMPLE